VLNYRKPVVFILMRGRGPGAEQQAVSNTISFPNLEGEPTNGHVSIHKTYWARQGLGAQESKGSAVAVHWNTGRLPPHRAGLQTVEYGRAPGQLWMQATELGVSSYGRDDMCGGVAAARGFRDGGQHWTAVLPGLVPGQTVYYRYGSAVDGWSSPAFFVAPSSPPTPLPPLAQPDGAREQDAGQGVNLVRVTRFFAFGDLGQHSPDDAFQHCDCPASRRNTDAMERLVAKSYLDGEPGAHAILHVGDLSYAMGYAAEWDAFFHQIAPLARRVPYMTAIGNHERDWPESGSNVGQYDSGGECGVPYAHRFPMPLPTPWPLGDIVEGQGKAPQRRVPDQPWYSFDQGLVHVAVLSSEHIAQVEWLEQDLAAVRRDVTPWVVVALHRPMYFTGVDGKEGNDYKVAAFLRHAYEEVLLRHMVDLVLAGHHHSYQRTCPIFNYTCAPHVEGGGAGYWGPVHVVIGMAGFANTPIIMSPPRQFVYTNSHDHGFTRFSAHPEALTFEYLVPLVCGDGSGTSESVVDGCLVKDSFVLSH